MRNLCQVMLELPLSGEDVPGYVIAYAYVPDCEA